MARLLDAADVEMAPSCKAHRSEFQQQHPDDNCELRATTAVARCALEVFEALAPHARLSDNQTLVCAAFVVRRESALGTSAHDRRLECVAAGTGTRCVGFDGAMTPRRRALTLADCHAEVVARRQLVLWLLQEAMRACTADAGTSADAPSHMASAPPPVFERVHRTPNDSSPPSASLRLRPGVSLHLVVTKAPCGDACLDGDELARPSSSAADKAPPPTGGRKVVNTALLDTSADGVPIADTVGGYRISRHFNGIDDNEVGCVRVKPGKGKPAMLMSCSDKITKWAALGLAPASLADVLPLVPLGSVTVVDPTARAARLRRAFLARTAHLAACRLATEPPAGVGPRCYDASHVADDVVRSTVGLVAGAIGPSDEPTVAQQAASLTAGAPSPVSVGYRRLPPRRQGATFAAVAIAAIGDRQIGDGALHVLNTKCGLPQGLTESTLSKPTAIQATLTLWTSEDSRQDADDGTCRVVRLKLALGNSVSASSPAALQVAAAAVRFLLAAVGQLRQPGQPVADIVVRHPDSPSRDAAAALPPIPGEPTASGLTAFYAHGPFVHWVHRVRPPFEATLRVAFVKEDLI